jgi:hypothetical protein
MPDDCSRRDVQNHDANCGQDRCPLNRSARDSITGVIIDRIERRFRLLFSLILFNELAKESEIRELVQVREVTGARWTIDLGVSN